MPGPPASFTAARIRVCNRANASDRLPNDTPASRNSTSSPLAPAFITSVMGSDSLISVARAAAADGMRVQAEQASRAVKEQARTMRDMIGSAQNMAKQIKMITKANFEHSASASSLLRSVSDIRQITDRNASGVKETRGGTDELLRRAQALTRIVQQPVHTRPNGRAPRGK